MHDAAQRLHVDKFHLGVRESEQRRVGAIAGLDRIQRDRAVEPDYRLRLGRHEMDLHRARQRAARNLESQPRRQILRIAGKIQAMKIKVEQRLGRRAERFGVAVDLERAAVDHHLHEWLHVGIDIGRQIRDERHRDPDLRNRVMLLQHLIVETHVAVVEPDI